MRDLIALIFLIPCVGMIWGMALFAAWGWWRWYRHGDGPFTS